MSCHCVRTFSVAAIIIRSSFHRVLLMAAVMSFHVGSLDFILACTIPYHVSQAFLSSCSSWEGPQVPESRDLQAVWAHPRSRVI